MRIDFEDGGFVEISKSPNKFNEIYLVIGTRDQPLQMNINTAILNYSQFKELVSGILINTESENQE